MFFECQVNYNVGSKTRLKIFNFGHQNTGYGSVFSKNAGSGSGFNESRSKTLFVNILCKSCHFFLKLHDTVFFTGRYRVDSDSMNPDSDSNESRSKTLFLFDDIL